MFTVNSEAADVDGVMREIESANEEERSRQERLIEVL